MVEDDDKARGFRAADGWRKEAQAFAPHGQAGRALFHLKDDTSGCTVQAKDFSRLAADFSKVGVEVIGVSPDGSKATISCAGNMTLRSTSRRMPTRAVARTYGVWVEKSM
jgi:thioredoxin-dependent peroxiredoxin